jgi:hypothetical protein
MTHHQKKVLNKQMHPQKEEDKENLENFENIYIIPPNN